MPPSNPNNSTNFLYKFIIILNQHVKYLQVLQYKRQYNNNIISFELCVRKKNYDDVAETYIKYYIAKK